MWWGEVMKFKEVESGLYFFRSYNKSDNKKLSPYSYLNLVSTNKTNFTRRQVEISDCA